MLGYVEVLVNFTCKTSFFVFSSRKRESKKYEGRSPSHFDTYIVCLIEDGVIFAYCITATGEGYAEILPLINYLCYFIYLFIFFNSSNSL
ncbi:hypothetical protein LWI28_021555 [Acer negundo]|uniref:Uncharacterized protein n=1 Tax=Acer negundo TaxID=4023 RepID=A0AAD5JM82_ACENE|nr:hypothetical protein LWI28_021555 [Acer negundo]